MGLGAFGTFVDNHNLDCISVWPGDSNTGAAFGCVVPGLSGEGDTGEMRGKSVVRERAGAAGEVAAVKGCFASRGA